MKKYKFAFLILLIFFESCSMSEKCYFRQSNMTFAKNKQAIPCKCCECLTNGSLTILLMEKYTNQNFVICPVIKRSDGIGIYTFNRLTTQTHDFFGGFMILDDHKLDVQEYTYDSLKVNNFLKEKHFTKSQVKKALKKLDRINQSYLLSKENGIF